MSTLLRLPIATTRSSGRHRKRSATRSLSAPEMRTGTPSCLHTASSLDARFTSSPMTVHSIRLRDPTLPCSTDPTLSPSRIRSGGSPSATHLVCRVRSSSIWLRATSHATAAWSSSRSGEFQKARMASPMYLPTVPPLRSMQSDMASRYSESTLMSLCGSSSSDMVVKPAMSLNMMVTSRWATPSCATVPIRFSSRTTRSGT
mmetsp:Transcript_34347/g.90726  ORF Transcript_34347/g.90726 Transcript_34347/m.90726 type:complete len:202 (-) Transcript_34347:273-878(-)